jgi:UDP-N-acetyl-D-mannosaminuronic acid transferase (WecB/TagA/CpsF family)
MWEREEVGRVGIEWYYRLFVNGENLARSFGLLRR